MTPPEGYLPFTRISCPAATDTHLPVHQGYEVVDDCVRDVWVMTPRVLSSEDEAIAFNKNKASVLLYQTDYLDLPSTSVLIPNKTEIDAYRMALRLIAINPQLVVTEWPVKPKTLWTF